MIKTLNLPIQIIGPTFGEYVPIIREDIRMPYEVDPRESLEVNVDLENLNFRNLTTVYIALESNLFWENRTFSLNPRERKTETFTFELEDTVPLDISLVGSSVKLAISVLARWIFFQKRLLQ